MRWIVSTRCNTKTQIHLLVQFETPRLFLSLNSSFVNGEYSQLDEFYLFVDWSSWYLFSQELVYLGQLELRKWFFLEYITNNFRTSPLWNDSELNRLIEADSDDIDIVKNLGFGSISHRRYNVLSWKIEGWAGKRGKRKWKLIAENESASLITPHFPCPATSQLPWLFI